MLTAPEALRAAADLIERDGWCRTQLQSKDGRHCAVGAINAVLTPASMPVTYCVPEGVGPVALQAYEAILREIDQLDGYVTFIRDDTALYELYQGGVWSWNDDSADRRGPQDALHVATVFRHAAKHLEAGE
jgi:hypothetical protein